MSCNIFIKRTKNLLIDSNIIVTIKKHVTYQLIATMFYQSTNDCIRAHRTERGQAFCVRYHATFE